MSPPVSEEVQLSTLEYLKRQSPFMVIMVLMLGVVAWDDHFDREAQIKMMTEMREIDKQRLEAITGALARLSEQCARRSE